MVRPITAIVAALALSSGSTTAVAKSVSINLTLRVAVQCTVSYQPSLVATAGTTAVPLGQLREYCNAPSGYQLVVSYTPGSLRGATLQAGEDRVVLNGSGEAIISQSPRPRNRIRVLSAMPGEGGFDTDRLQFEVRPA